MNKNHMLVVCIVSLLGFGIIAYKEDTRCTHKSTPSCHYTLRDKVGPF